MEEWMTVIQHAISDGLNSQISSASAAGAGGGGGGGEGGDASVLERLQLTVGNGQCADCGAPAPDWASINLGVVRRRQSPCRKMWTFLDDVA